MSKTIKPPLKGFNVSVDAGCYIYVKATNADEAKGKVCNMSTSRLLRELEGNIEVGSDIEEDE